MSISCCVEKVRRYNGLYTQHGTIKAWATTFRQLWAPASTCAPRAELPAQLACQAIDGQARAASLVSLPAHNRRLKQSCNFSFNPGKLTIEELISHLLLAFQCPNNLPLDICLCCLNDERAKPRCRSVSSLERVSSEIERLQIIDRVFLNQIVDAFRFDFM